MLCEGVDSIREYLKKVQRDVRSSRALVITLLKFYFLDFKFCSQNKNILSGFELPVLIDHLLSP